MKRFTYISLVIVLFLILLPVFALTAATNLRALASTAVSIFLGPKIPADEYAYGNCTYWVALRRIQIGQPIPNTWGNAITWAQRAIKDGYLVDHTPSLDSIMQDPNALGGLGHVAFVEKVNNINGDWTISEMNRIGWDEVDERVMPPAVAIKYNFIH